MNLNLMLGNETLGKILQRQTSRVHIPENFSCSFMLWDKSTAFSYDNPTNVWFQTTYKNCKELQEQLGKKIGINQKIVELAVKQGQRFTVHGNFVHFG